MTASWTAPAAIADPALLPIAWLYLATNALRVLSYLPQIAAVWRCRDGATALSLWAWALWTLSHATAAAYGVRVLGDPLFVGVSLLNLAGCAAVTWIACCRRHAASRRRRPVPGPWRRA